MFLLASNTILDEPILLHLERFTQILLSIKDSP